MEDIITLVGPRATGKSTVGKELAQKLGYDFIEMDRYVDHELGMKIFTFAEQYGWDAYMKRLHEILKEAVGRLRGKKVVLDLGGGTIAAPSSPISAAHAQLNAELLQKHTKIVLILPYENDSKSKEVLFQREFERHKKGGYYKLGSPDPTKTQEELFKEKVIADFDERVPTYKKYAHHHIYANEQSPRAVAELIMRTILTE